MYDKRDSFTSRHNITQDRLICHKHRTSNQIFVSEYVKTFFSICYACFRANTSIIKLTCISKENKTVHYFIFTTKHLWYDPKNMDNRMFKIVHNFKSSRKLPQESDGKLGSRISIRRTNRKGYKKDLSFRKFIANIICYNDNVTETY